MICEKCGSNNPKNSAVCTKCGANMPTTEICGGFADILSYNGPASSVTNVSGIDEKTIQRLERKVNAALATSRKLTILTFISLAFCVILLVCFILTSCSFTGCSFGKKEETVAPPSSTEQTIDQVTELPEFIDGTVNDISVKK